MPDIKALNSEISRLSGAVDWWNSAIIVMMIVAAVAASGLVATQFIAFARAKALTEAQSQLERSAGFATGL